MAEALDSAYLWGITPFNQGNLSAKQRTGLGSLAPQAGYGLNPAPRPAALNPYADLPEPQFAPNAADYFQWTQPAARAAAQKAMAGGTDLVHSAPLQAFGPNNAAKINDPSQKPYFDPNYPMESMLALRNWLKPQVQEGSDAAMHARGLDYTGIKPDSAVNYLNGIAPNVSTDEATAMDLERLYGPDIRNGLVGGGLAQVSHGSYGLPASRIPLPSELPGASTVGDGSHVSNPAFLANPNYAKTGGLHLLSGPDAGHNNVPEMGLFNFGTDPNWTGAGAYAGPGYWYDPNSMPDASQMPWLAPSQKTSPTSGTSGTAP